MNPGEIGLLVFMLIFTITTFIIIYMLLIGFLLGPGTGGGGATGLNPTGIPIPTGFTGCSATGGCDGLRGFVCMSGYCQCTTGSVYCPNYDRCLDLSRSVISCGSCNIACTGPQICCSGICRNTMTDVTACGRCGAGACTGIQPACCNGSCRDLATSLTSCGACLNACAPGQICCAGQCVTPNTNSHCGGCTGCGPGTVCTGSPPTCVPGCAPPYTDCGGVCVDLMNDVDNCQFCGFACPTGTYCSGGNCVPNTCPENAVSNFWCPNLELCVDLQTSNQACGECSRVCSVYCDNGLCACTSNADCASGETCTFSQIVSQQINGPPTITLGPGRCQPPTCGPNRSWCAGTSSCSTLSVSPRNCGTCGNQCPSGACDGGRCTCDDDSQCNPGFYCVSGLCELH
jgi:hypothetical protein